MIAKVEKDVRLRLDKDIFGADSDTLEGITLAALEQRGWSLACIESGLDGALLRRFGQADTRSIEAVTSRRSNQVHWYKPPKQSTMNSIHRLPWRLHYPSPVNARIFPLPSLLRSAR